MRKFIFGVLLTITVLFVYDRCGTDSVASGVSEIKLIEDQIKSVGKLVVSEGYFSEVFTYEDSKELLGSYFTAQKKALVVVKTDVKIAYDLSQLTYELDSLNRMLKITKIPDAEIAVYPEFEYYDIQSDFFNAFEPEDYNRIKKEYQSKVMQKIEDSNLKANAKNRLISELSKFYILTQSMGWTLLYEEKPIEKTEDLKQILF
jgi:hypothetical protein